jgi:hypothetical protein
VTRRPDPTTVAGPATPEACASAEPNSAEFDIGQFWAAVASYRELMDEFQAEADRAATDLENTRRLLAEREARSDATPWELEELREEIGEKEALLASVRRSLEDGRERLRQWEEKDGRSAIRELLTERLPQLEIWGLVGRGGMGEVWKARHKQLGRDVAIKVLPPEFGREPGFAQRFRQEAAALARLSHPNIIPIHDFGEVGGLYFFIMEYLPHDLRWRVENLYTLETCKTPDTRVYFILRDFLSLCSAVGYAHEQGVLHRDIKPENILVGAGDVGVKLADFGLVRLLQPGTARLTRPGQAVGTFSYMAPEQLDRPAEADQRADVYALGVVLYELLTGRLPLGQFEPPSKASGDERLDPIVRKALATDPAERYQNVAELKAALEKLHQAGAFWRERKASKQSTALSKDLMRFAGWALLPLALALYTLLESGRVLPWWLLAALPCAAEHGVWKARWLRTATFLTWFGLLPAYIVLGQALGWEPVFGGKRLTGIFPIGMFFLSLWPSFRWPDRLKAANNLRGLHGLPPLRPFQPPWTSLSEKVVGCWLVGAAACGLVWAYVLLPDKVVYWLPTAVTLWITVNVGWYTILHAWVSDRLNPEWLDD